MMGMFDMADRYQVAHRWVKQALQYRDTWRGGADCYWLAKLVEEVGELAVAIVGIHEHTVEHELDQIGSICMNWLVHRKERR